MCKVQYYFHYHGQFDPTNRSLSVCNRREMMPYNDERHPPLDRSDWDCHDGTENRHSDDFYHKKCDFTRSVQSRSRFCSSAVTGMCTDLNNRHIFTTYRN